MSGHAVNNLFAPVIEAAVASMWRQWADLGGTAGSAGMTGALIDPEALVLASAALVEHERRLGEVLQSWVRMHGDLLSVQRLTNLAGRTRAFPRHDPEGIAAIAVDGPNGHRWKRLAGESAPAGHAPFHLRSAPPLGLTAPSTAMLRLRLAMGVGVKADALAYLLGTHTWRSVQEVTRATGYTVAGVRRALDELAQARFIESEDPVEWQARRARHFRADSSRWKLLLDSGDTLPAWGYYRERFDFVVHISQWMHEGNATLTWDPLQLGEIGKEWMKQYPLAFRFGDADRAAFRGKLGDWSAHFRESLEELTAWFGGEG